MGNILLLMTLGLLGVQGLSLLGAQAQILDCSPGISSESTYHTSSRTILALDDPRTDLLSTLVDDEEQPAAPTYELSISSGPSFEPIIVPCSTES
jgi:hypothetical protein